jgi:RHS repeat-associated protein
VQKQDTRGALGLQTHNFSWGPGGLLHEDNPTTVYTPGFGHRSNGVNKFYHVDWLGSTRYTSDITGNSFPAAMRFDAYGQRSATGGTDPYHSTDLQFAATWGYQTEWSGAASDPGLGLQYLQQRYYDQATGRFISPDPIGIAGGFNLYSYVSNNPIALVDPLGLSGWKYFHGGVGVVLGGLLGGVPGAMLGGGLFYGMASYGETQDAGEAIREGQAVAATVGALGSVGSVGLQSLSYSRMPGRLIGPLSPPPPPSNPPGTLLPARPTATQPLYVAPPTGPAVRIPPGYFGRVADSGKGSVWQPIGATNPNADAIRIMDPKVGGKYPYPEGYVQFYNGCHPVIPIIESGALVPGKQTGTEQDTHFAFPRW